MANDRDPGARTPRQGPLVHDHELAHLHLASVLNGYTNAAEQVDGVPPGAPSPDDHDNTMDGIRHGRPDQTMEIAAELVGDLPARDGGTTGR
ncbi:MAG: hypothetical protein IRZ18_06910 [Clostridia bacterium]|nr:hypothetical protein [Clostridia bacterium]